MSSDNYLAIWLDDDGRYRAYDRSASENRSPTLRTKPRARGFPAFEASTLASAITQAQDYYPCEYGYTFVNISNLAAVGATEA